MTRRALRFTRGQRLTDLRDPLNRLVRIANSQSSGQGALPVGALPTIELEIKSLGTDTLLCVDPGQGAATGVREYTVVLPPTFTELSRGGVTYTYTDINNRVADGTENQKLTPEYIVGDTIRAGYRLEGDGSLIDMNIDGRQWARV